jgi:hypothetical protein
MDTVSLKIRACWGVWDIRSILRWRRFWGSDVVVIRRLGHSPNKSYWTQCWSLSGCRSSFVIIRATSARARSRSAILLAMNLIQKLLRRFQTGITSQTVSSKMMQGITRESNARARPENARTSMPNISQKFLRVAQGNNKPKLGVLRRPTFLQGTTGTTFRTGPDPAKDSTRSSDVLL